MTTVDYRAIFASFLGSQLSKMCKVKIRNQLLQKVIAYAHITKCQFTTEYSVEEYLFYIYKGLKFVKKLTARQYHFHQHVVKQHFTTRHMYPNPYPRSIAATTYSKCYVPKFIRKNFPCDKR